MPLFFSIAIKHLLARKRQSVVSLLGIMLGVAFFIAIASLMLGLQKDTIKRLVDNIAHILIIDEFRSPRLQPVQELNPNAAVELKSLKRRIETRGIRDYEQILEQARNIKGVAASVLMGQVLINSAGSNNSIVLNGMIPSQINNVSIIKRHMISGSVENLIASPNGIIIGEPLAWRLSLSMGKNVTLTTASGQVRTFKIVGIFRTGDRGFDEYETFADLRRVQAFLNRPSRINNIIIKLNNPYEARDIAANIERTTDYRIISWQEASEQVMNMLTIQNLIMYSVVSAVLVVAAFGIYNVISTIVLEKQRDIAILKSIGFHSNDIKHIFITQGLILGSIGSILGSIMGSGLMWALLQIHFIPPGSSEEVQMPIDWDILPFLIATGFAMLSAIFAAFLPARKAVHVQPVDIIRGIA